jgi:hypothetical protein
MLSDILLLEVRVGCMTEVNKIRNGVLDRYNAWIVSVAKLRSVGAGLSSVRQEYLFYTAYSL